MSWGPAAHRPVHFQAAEEFQETLHTPPRWKWIPAGAGPAPQRPRRVPIRTRTESR